MKKQLNGILGLLAILTLCIGGTVQSAEPASKAGFEWEGFRKIAIQNRGRVKPMDTYAQEAVQFVTGKTQWNGMKSIEVVWSWLTSFQTTWVNTQFIKIDFLPLRRAIGLDLERNHYSPSELEGLDGLRKIVQGAMKKQQTKEALSDLEKKAVQVQNQLGLLDAIVRGQDVTLLPNPKGLDSDWFPLSALTENGGQLPYSGEQRNELGKKLKPVIEAYINDKPVEFNQAVPVFVSFLKTGLAPGAYPSDADLSREILYNDAKPFRWAWVLYTFAFIFLLSFIFTKNQISRWLAIASLAGAYGYHVFGFALRCWIAGRPPVTNMYESIIWVTFGCMTFSFIIWAAYKNALIPTAAAAFAVTGLVLADNLPIILDPAINPLEPVLRSNYWLTIHVLTITLSYAAFSLSLCLGNVVLGNYLFRTDNTARIQQVTLYMYRAVQIGVVLLATGTILGGVWADYSWGRFWGWDPKEVWALIALLLYLAVLHGRFTGWLKGFGFAATTVLCFQGVLMAWYGVNFVLGVGLHSYGFGTGGNQYVLTYVGAQCLFILAAYFKYVKVKKDHNIDTAIFPKGT